MDSLSEPYEISTEARRLDVELIHDFLRASYWARNIPRSVVEKSLEHSLCFGVFSESQQVGFGRVITDFATFAYIADVFVVPKHRARGVSKLLLRAILDHPQLQGLRRVLLATQDAHGLYRQFGFETLAHPEHFMSIANPGIHGPEKEPGGTDISPTPH
ncbi:MAG: GNAT family N-acetyltransferase [Verrucomicrobiales bacterium]